MAVQIWYSDQGTLTFGGTDFTAQVREISVTGGGREIEEVQTFGVDANGRPNSVLYGKRMELIEAQVTFVFQGYEPTQWWAGGTDSTMPILINGEDPRSPLTIIYLFSQGTGANEHQVRLTFTNAYAVSHELSVEADGYISQTITFKCDAKNFKFEYTDNASDNPLP